MYKNILNDSNEKIAIEEFNPKVKEKSTIIFCHGFTGCRKGRTKNDNYFQILAQKLMNLGYKVVLFDFSGHGDSEGNDYDVCLSKNTHELELVYNEEITNSSDVNFLTFSYGSCVLINFLQAHPSIHPKHIVMYSPALYMLEGSLLNENLAFGKDVIQALNNNDFIKKGYGIIKSKDFKLGNKFIKEFESFSCDYLKNFKNNLLVISGYNDVVIDTSLNDNFFKENHIRNIWLDTSHSLFEDIYTAFNFTIGFFEE